MMIMKKEKKLRAEVVVVKHRQKIQECLKQITAFDVFDFHLDYDYECMNSHLVNEYKPKVFLG